MRSIPRRRSQSAAASTSARPTSGIVERVEEAEEPRLVRVEAQVLVVELRRAAAREPPVLPRGEQGDLAAPEEGVLAGREAGPQVEFEGRHPRRVALEHDVTRAQEVAEVLAGGVLADLDRHGPGE
ncbi:MAG: hypothetical protein M5U28_26125 [Sandaracinaceae bacterium]|nr:hypothetical protein [Sandaracinaceae bacterium]